ncbi:MAG TPA: hypothetical protein DEF47_23565 [Herpetosiphon sp.]|uniref:Uncharacterized protein n=1 Tax=Herpetosiphon aurantiacus (strain ATCC 23779 / DSM 785 / 114-95) TaxID=316274 RepID=A9B2N9_HERA2|nr:hypothetical protein [Herpetosiphon sp.]ABX05490.1 conserved hypothetical protein [Herpetosiphon aurantiacus DSM 785]HBW52872.1 hypothetical protein [Herpetosiphon sp.]
MGYGYGYAPPPPPRRRGCLFGCLTTLTIFVFLALGGLLGVYFYLRPMLSEQAGNTLGGQLEQQIDRKLDEQLGGPNSEIPAGFQGVVQVTDTEINQYIQANPNEISPLDSATVRFTPGRLGATVGAYGMTGSASAGVQVTADGRIDVVDAQIDGALGFFLDAEQLAQTLETKLNSQLTANGQRITAIEVGEGVLTATVEAQ